MMFPFALEHAETLTAPHGLIAKGEGALDLRRAVLDRPERYDGLSLAAGSDWAALFEVGTVAPENATLSA